jgi:hypothetical protein
MRFGDTAPRTRDPCLAWPHHPCVIVSNIDTRAIRCRHPRFFQMILSRLLAVGVLIAPLSGSAVGIQKREQAPKQRLTLGVMRSDGILLPFAAFDGSKWSTPWPSAIGGGLEGGPSELPANLAAIPEDWWGPEVPSQWHLWSREGEPALLFKILSPATIRIGIARRFALRTDYRANFNPFVPPFELPYPKEGLAVGGEVPVQRILSVSRRAPAFQHLLDRIRPDIDAAEERTIGALRANARWAHPFDKTVRSKVDPELEAWYTAPIGQTGANVSYIEAVKKYPVLPEDKGCGLESFISGWVHQDERQSKPKTQLKVVVTYCDRDKASYMLPLGLMQLRDRTHWAFQMSGQDHEWYAVAELAPGRTRVVAEYYAGGYPRNFAR